MRPLRIALFIFGELFSTLTPKTVSLKLPPIQSYPLGLISFGCESPYAITASLLWAQTPQFFQHQVLELAGLWTGTAETPLSIRSADPCAWGLRGASQSLWNG